MAATLFEQSTTAASNTDIAGINQAEGCAPSTMNDATRGIVAQMKGALLSLTAGGTANAITVTQTPVPAAYTTGMFVNFKAASTNTGATTLNLNGLGAKNVFRQSGASLVACTGGEIISGQIVTCFYDGTQFQLVSLLPGSYLLATATASTSATIDFTTGIDTTFDEYEIRFNNLVPATNATQLFLRISQSATFKSGATNYAFVRNILSDAGTNTPNGTPIGTGAAQITMTSSTISNTAGRGVQGVVRFSRPGVNSELKFFDWSLRHFDGTNSYLTTGTGFYGVDGNAIDGVRLLMSSGNISTGNFYLFGIRK